MLGAFTLATLAWIPDVQTDLLTLDHDVCGPSALNAFGVYGCEAARVGSWRQWLVDLAVADLEDSMGRLALIGAAH